MRLNELLSYTKECPDGWSKYALLNLKLDKNSSSCLVREKIGVYVRKYPVCAF